MIDHRLTMLAMIAHHGSVTAAAEALSYTPSTVSYQVKQLARELNVTLLEHRGRRVRLTPAARSLLRHVERISAQWERALGELDAHTESVTGELTLAGFSTAASALLPATMSALNHAFPELVTRAMEAEPEESYDLLLSGEVDVAVVVMTPSTPPQSDQRFVQRRLLDDPLDLMVPRGHRLAELSSVSLSRTAQEPWIVARPGSTYHQLVVSACVGAGFTPDIAHYADEWETGTALVAEGFGVSLVSRLARWPDYHPVVRIPLRGEHTPTRRVGVVTKAGAQHRRTVSYALRVLAETAERLMSTLKADLSG